MPTNRRTSHVSAALLWRIKALSLRNYITLLFRYPHTPSNCSQYSISTMTTVTFYLFVISTIVGVASGFLAPSVIPTTTTTALASEKVPCFGAAPFLGDTKVFFGENYWNKLTSEYGTEATGTYLRAAYVNVVIYNLYRIISRS